MVDLRNDDLHTVETCPLSGGSVAGDRPPRQWEWQMDAVEQALRESTQRQRPDPDLPGPYCVEMGRRLLLAQLEAGDWVLRRVEKVHFERDRCVHRRITVEMRIREDA